MANIRGQIKFIPMSVCQDTAPRRNCAPMPMQSSKEDRLIKKEKVGNKVQKSTSSVTNNLTGTDRTNRTNTGLSNTQMSSFF